MDYTSGLNNAQKEAVLHTEGPLLVLAGAGAGKTKTVTHRILNLIHKGVTPSNILAITFTNKAAKEMRERVIHLMNKDRDLNGPISITEYPFVSTFHALGVHILRENSALLGLKRTFTIYDKSDARRAVKEAVISSNLDPKQYDPATILGAISREKGNMVTLNEFEISSQGDYMKSVIYEIWMKYERTLAEEKALDFDDLLLKTALLLRDRPEIRAHYQSIWKYIHVDEYQDTNRVQYKIVDFLAGEHKNLCVVGDIDQNIYSWRGADIKNILNFERDYKDAKIVLLEENYRSTQVILDVANKIIEKNTRRREKNLFTKNNPGEKVKLIVAYDENDEARQIAETIENLIDKGTNPREIAILYRANFQSRVLEESCLRRNIPYQVLGTKFFERKEVKDVLAYIRAALNPESLADIKRVINEPSRGIGKVTLVKVLEGNKDSLPYATLVKVNDFYSLLEEIKELAGREAPSKVVQFIVKASGMEDVWSNDAVPAGRQGIEGEERLGNVMELASLATKYDAMPQGEGIEKMLEEAALASDQDEMKEDKDAVRLMTIHASKGLEFEHVFVTGLEQGLFPSNAGGKKDEKRDDEEERRLFYVALTRAKKRLYLSSAGMRTIFGQRQPCIPSEFLADIDESYIEEEKRETSSLARDIFIDF